MDLIAREQAFWRRAVARAQDGPSVLIATSLGAPRLLFCHSRRPVECSPRDEADAQMVAQHELVELVD